MIDYLEVSRILLSVHSFIKDTIDMIGASNNCVASEEWVDIKENEFEDVYGRFLMELQRFSQDSERYLSLISDMKYGFSAQDIKSEPQCLFPPRDVQEFIIRIGKMDRSVFDAFKKMGDLKLEVIKMAEACLGPAERNAVKARLQGVDNELDLSIQSKELFYHPMDEIEAALPVDMWPEDKRFIQLLFKCTTDVTTRLEEGLVYLRESGRGIKL